MKKVIKQYYHRCYKVLFKVIERLKSLLSIFIRPNKTKLKVNWKWINLFRQSAKFCFGKVSVTLCKLFLLPTRFKLNKIIKYYYEVILRVYVAKGLRLIKIRHVNIFQIIICTCIKMAVLISDNWWCIQLGIFN